MNPGRGEFGAPLSRSGSSTPTSLAAENRFRRLYYDPFARSVATNVSLILLWYFFGTFLSLWNKLLVGNKDGLYGQGAFPAPFLMSSLQFFSQYGLAKIVLGFKIVKRRAEEVTTWRQYFRVVVPNGVATGLDIGLSNTSLAFITLSFYVMCKSTTPLFLLTFAILWGIERPSWGLAAVVSIISLGLFLLVTGETEFNLVGFLMVMIAAALAGLRWTITQVLLQGDKNHGSRGGAIEIIESLTPIMGLTLLIISLLFESLWSKLPGSPYFESLPHTLVTIAVLLTGGLIAFCMVWAEFTLIANTSALTFMVAGTFKEIVTVGAAVIFLHEKFTLINAIGLVVLIAGVVLFNYFKYQKMKARSLEPIQFQEMTKAESRLGNDVERGPLLGSPYISLENPRPEASPRAINGLNQRKILGTSDNAEDTSERSSSHSGSLGT